LREPNRWLDSGEDILGVLLRHHQRTWEVTKKPGSIAGITKGEMQEASINRAQHEAAIHQQPIFISPKHRDYPSSPAPTRTSIFHPAQANHAKNIKNQPHPQIHQ
jgi:hypothetical protein